MGRVFSIRIEKDDLKSTAVDNEVLDILVSAISENIPDSQGTPSSKYAQNIVKLLELITSRFSSAHVFIICAKFYQSQGSYRKSLDYAQKAHRFVLNEQGLDTNSSIFNQLVHVTLGVVDAYKCLGDMLEPARMGYEPEPVCKDWKYQSKMAIKASLSRTKMVYETLAGYDTLNEKLQELKSE